MSASASPCAAILGLGILITMLAQQARLPAAAFAAPAPARGNLTAGDSLTPPQYITSPSGDFAFGFRALHSDPTKFLLATWFLFGDDGSSSSSSSSSAVVWFAKQSYMGTTPYATAGSVLSITTADGQLALTDGNNDQQVVLWKAKTPSMQRGSVLTLTDSGNVQFLGDGDGGSVLWESFWYPTDTLLPGQSLAPSSRFEGFLFSKRADEEFDTGRFSLAAQRDGNVVLCIDLFTGDINQNAYWATGTNSANGNTTITFDDQGFLNYTLYDGSVHSLISPTAVAGGASSNYFRFARMDADGIVRTYARPRNGSSSRNASWTVTGAVPEDGGCNKRTPRMQGLCGPGSYCTETKERLSCLCPSGYTYVDAQHSDSGCTPAFEPQSCGGGGGGVENSSSSDDDEFSLVEMRNTTWEILYYKKYPSVTEQQCREKCLGSCYCTAALMIGGGSACAEVGALTYGRQGDDVTTTALIKVRKGNNNNTSSYTQSKRPWQRKLLHPYMIVLVCLGFIFVATVGVLVAQHYAGSRNRESQQRPLSSSVRSFSWKELYQATNGFEKLLGKGSFGEVYRGTMRSPQPQLIAVKKLVDSNEYTEQEFTNEVQSVGQIHHRNLVRMIGYCKEGKHRMLVFEFMPGGSLRSFLFNPEKRRPPWQWRAEAALAIARGLEYLHDGCSAPIIHCDIKPDNILLDDRGVPRITDFGISKLLGTQQVHTTVTHVRGTRGYIAPEWFRGDARIDTKVDVYSFGVVLLEMICCRKCQEPVVVDPPQGVEGDETVTLFGWAAQLVGAQRTELMLHGEHVDIGSAEEMERVDRFARVALWCVEPNPVLRPTMHQVVLMLETSDRAQVQALPEPPDCYMESSPLILQLKD